MEITIIGKGGFAREVKMHLEAEYDFIMDINTKMLTSDELNGDEKECIVAISDPYVRERIVSENPEIKWSEGFADSLGYYNPDEDKTGVGCIICPDVIITDNVSIGKHCQFNIQTSIGHDCNIGDFVTTAPKVSISGNVTIGNRVYIGTGAIIKEKTYICDDVIIGAGAVVLNDITQPGTYVGIPAKKIK
jgi:sugar O-acyltransferase (sialic acid O-acetyltransferase NeuD family)